MDFQSIIIDRRDGRRHTERELRFLAEGAASGAIPDYQLAAWLMAEYLNPVNDDEMAWLTVSLAESGERIDLTGLPKPWIDKHSTGGVGDKTTIILMPILAACGATVVKMSGRGLGTTGGTLDKLASVPGFRVDLSPDEMKDQAARIGLAITGQTPTLAPADKALYALRDVTGTVESIPLLVSSILSKKIAGGADSIVLDVKSGSGGFMRTAEGAKALAAGLARTAKVCGLNCRLALTDMSQPLGAVGNAIEIEQSLAILRNEPDGPETKRQLEFCAEMAAIALETAGLAPDRAAGRKQALAALQSGGALEKARQWFEAQGGSIDAPLPKASCHRTVVAEDEGWISRLDAETVGVAIIEIGGGRRQKEDVIDPAVGVDILLPVGARVERGTPLFTIFSATEAACAAGANKIRSAYAFSSTPVAETETILQVM